MTHYIISTDKERKVEDILVGTMTVDNSGTNKVKIAIRILRIATLEEYKIQCENFGYPFDTLLPHGPYYYEAEALD